MDTELAEFLEKLFPEEYAKRLVERIQYLQKTVLEESDAMQNPLNMVSLVCFAKYLIKHNYLPYPSIVFTPGGNIRARWTRWIGEGREIQSLEFRKENENY